MYIVLLHELVPVGLLHKLWSGAQSIIQNNAKQLMIITCLLSSSNSDWRRMIMDTTTLGIRERESKKGQWGRCHMAVILPFRLGSRGR